MDSSKKAPTSTASTPKHANQVQGNRLKFQGDTHYQYDAKGNRIAQVRGKGQKLKTAYRYNSLNQLVAVNNNGANTVYQYDALGRRISKQSQHERTDFLWFEDVLLSETTQTRNSVAQTSLQTKVYLFEPNTFKPLAFVQDEVLYHYHLDHLGTPQEITNANGEVVWAASFKAYGNLAVALVNDVENNIRFQGQYHDSETGMHYNRFRYYDPCCGRFVNQDPIGLLGGSNNYQYVPNPVGWVDPFGLSCKEKNISSRGRIPENQQGVFNEFELDHQGQFTSDEALVKAYEGVRDKESPWPVGYTPKTRVIQPGEKFNMITDTGRGNYPGSFGTMDNIENAIYGRNQLAIKEEWKGTLDRKVQYEVLKPYEVEYGPVGPQIDELPDGSFKYLPGGGTQIKMGYKDFQNAVPTPENGKIADPYLKVLKNTKLSQK